MVPVLKADLMGQLAVLIPGQVRGQALSRTPVMAETVFRNANLRSPRQSKLMSAILQALPRTQSLSSLLTPMPLKAYVLTRP